MQPSRFFVKAVHAAKVFQSPNLLIIPPPREKFLVTLVELFPSNLVKCRGWLSESLQCLDFIFLTPNNFWLLSLCLKFPRIINAPGVGLLRRCTLEEMTSIMPQNLQKRGFLKSSFVILTTENKHGNLLQLFLWRKKRFQSIEDYPH